MSAYQTLPPVSEATQNMLGGFSSQRRSSLSAVVIGAIVGCVCVMGYVTANWAAAGDLSLSAVGARGVVAPMAMHMQGLRPSMSRDVGCDAIMFGHGINERISKEERRSRRKLSIRKKVEGTSEKPRLSVFRSNNHIYGQIIDDSLGHTLAAAGTVEKVVKEQIADKTPKEQAEIVGKLLGERAKEKGIERVVFDRNGYKYHGRVAGIADGAREAGLQF